MDRRRFLRTLGLVFVAGSQLSGLGVPSHQPDFALAPITPSPMRILPPPDMAPLESYTVIYGHPGMGKSYVVAHVFAKFEQTEVLSRRDRLAV